MTFLDVEKAIAGSLRDRVESTADTMNAEDVKNMATRRQAGHWVSPHVPGSVDRSPQGTERRLRRPGRRRRLLRPAEPASGRLRVRRCRRRCIGPTRRTCSASTSSTVTSAKPAILPSRRTGTSLKKLREQVEAAYVNWYITHESLGLGQVRRWTAYSKLADRRAYPTSNEFFHKHVQPTPGRSREPQSLRHHQRCLPLRSRLRN